MPNDCWNRMTITCLEYEYTEELKNLIKNELQYEEKENDEKNDEEKDKENKEGQPKYHEIVRMIRCGRRGIIFEIWSPWNPDYEWLEGLLDKYPNCWIKDEWSEEGGNAGVWVGYNSSNNQNNEKEKMIQSFAWDDLCIEGKEYLFMSEEEEKDKERRMKM